MFVGSDCQLVAPVTLGDGAIIGAGSTITADVPPGALALTRAALVLKEGAAERLRARQKGPQGVAPSQPRHSRSVKVASRLQRIGIT